MFTGIVETTGRIEAVDAPAGPDGDRSLRIGCASLDTSRLRRGDSVAVSGVCLTAVEIDAGGFRADVSAETLACTTLGAAAIGRRVNLETALRLDRPLGGHLVSGHVDAVGSLVSRAGDARSVRMRFALPGALARFVAAKGSICVDGVSLTVNDVGPDDFGVNVVPHTLAVTTLGDLGPGEAVNLEVDLIARYLERLADPHLRGAG